MAEDPVAQMVADPFRVLLGAGHPHNALLQIWVELGAAGAVLAATLLVLTTIWAWRLRGLAAVIVAGLAGTVLSIAAVSHGAWQGWWIADVGAAIALIAAKLREMPHARL
jgi:O-antigen ligase